MINIRKGLWPENWLATKQPPGGTPFWIKITRGTRAITGLKALLHMAVLNAIRFNEPLKAYYQRKVAEGKAKMLVINNVRNKLLHQLVAVIRQGKPDQMTTIPKA